MDSPKARFLRTNKAKLHANTVADPLILEYFDIALLQYQWELAGGSDVGSAAASHMHISGALRLRSIFLNLSQAESTPRAIAQDNLNHD